MKKVALIAFLLGYLVFDIHYHVTQEPIRPYTVNERQTWFRENGYLDVNDVRNFDGKCGTLLHDAEKDAMFWNYERRY